MLRKRKRVQKPVEVPQGLPTLETQIMLLLLLLNGEEEFGEHPGVSVQIVPFARRRAITLLIGRFRSLESEFHRAPRSAAKDSSGPIDVSENIRAINRFLKRYAAVPRVNDLRRIKKSDAPRGWAETFEPLDRKLEMEFLLVRSITSLASLGLLDRLRQCSNCQKWMYAKRSDGRFCKKACYDHFHTYNEADKKRRREAARGYYRLKVERDKANLRRA